jgi:hypothetical protein
MLQRRCFAFKIGKNVLQLQVNPEENALMRITNISPVAEIPSFDDFMKVAPNPFNDDFKITFSAEPLNDMLIKVLNTDGKEILSIKGRKRHEIKLRSKMPLPVFICFTYF